MRKTILIIVIVVSVSLFVMTIAFPAYLYRQSDDLLTITYVCTTGLKPNAFSAYRTYDNGTHTIDTDSCAWIANSDYKSAAEEFQQIHSMSCDEILNRHNSGKPYQNNENRIYTESRISTCGFIDEWSKIQKMEK